MGREGYRGPKLPGVLLDRVQSGRAIKTRRQEVPRKAQHTTERLKKKAGGQLQQHQYKSRSDREDIEEDVEDASEQPSSPVRENPTAVAGSRPYKATATESQRLQSTSGDGEPALPLVSRAVKDRLAADDAEIEALEKKLGIKGKKSKALADDGLDWLVDASEGESADDSRRPKRKRLEDDRWLRNKRLKGTGVEEDDEDDEDEEEGEEEGENMWDDSNLAEDKEDSDGFSGFDSNESEDDERLPPKRVRENPYVAPVSQNSITATKYVPPSLRTPSASDEEALKHLRRQLQGQLNRLSEANILSILQAVETLYEKNARQHVTSTLGHLLVGLVSDPSPLNDTFLVLHAAFSAALYKVVGTDFGAQLLEKTVESFNEHRLKSEGKHSLNLIAFVSCLYTFQVVGSKIIFDYIRFLLDELSETNTELLLRVIRTCGPQLRHDDPSSLKDIVLLLRRSIARVGEDKLSVRTKFMVDAIQDLKNNRTKAGAAASAATAEHATRMKKTLGSLNARAKSTEPLQIGLADIQDSAKKGKWWLVGASYNDPAKLAQGGKHDAIATSSGQDTSNSNTVEHEELGNVSLRNLAKAQGMNTDVRRAIFITLLSSVDYVDAHTRLIKLSLTSTQRLEISRVIVHCAATEQTYNPYYALVARRFCGVHRLRKAFQFALWDAFKRMDPQDDDDDDDTGEADGAEKKKRMNTQTIVNLARFYGTLLAKGSLPITILQPLDLTRPSSPTAVFAEVALTTALVRLRSSDGDGFERAVADVLTPASGVDGLAMDLRGFVSTTLSRATLAEGKKERTAVRRGCEVALETLAEAASAMTASVRE